MRLKTSYFGDFKTWNRTHLSDTLGLYYITVYGTRLGWKPVRMYPCLGLLHYSLWNQIEMENCQNVSICLGLLHYSLYWDQIEMENSHNCIYVQAYYITVNGNKLGWKTVRMYLCLGLLHYSLRDQIEVENHQNVFMSGPILLHYSLLYGTRLGWKTVRIVSITKL